MARQGSSLREREMADNALEVELMHALHPELRFSLEWGWLRRKGATNEEIRELVAQAFLRPETGSRAPYRQESRIAVKPILSFELVANGKSRRLVGPLLVQEVRKVLKIPKKEA